MKEVTMLERLMWCGTMRSSCVELNLAKDHVCLEAGLSPVEASDENSALANTFSAAF